MSLPLGVNAGPCPVHHDLGGALTEGIEGQGGNTCCCPFPETCQTPRGTGGLRPAASSLRCMDMVPENLGSGVSPSNGFDCITELDRCE